MVHEASSPGVGRVGNGACREGSLCVRRYAAESLRKGFVSKLKRAMKEQGKGEEADLVRHMANSCSSLFVESYLTFVSEEQKQVGVPVKCWSIRSSTSYATCARGLRWRLRWRSLFLGPET